jgi:hypothetical protein
MLYFRAYFFIGGYYEEEQTAHKILVFIPDPIDFWSSLRPRFSRK